MMFETLIGASELLRLTQSDSDVCIFDCRFSLADTGLGKKLWLESHIPGAFYAHLDDDLSGTIVPMTTGRHPLPEKKTFVDWLRLHGISPDTQIIAYDAAGGAIACRLWWLCQWIGHSSCAVLDGGFKEWVKIAALDSQKPDLPAKGSIVAEPPLLKSMNTEDIIKHKDDLLLVDARELPRYLGEQEPIDPVAGHIPGALSYPFPENLDDQGNFKTPQELRERFKNLDDKKREVIMYCGSGVTAIHNILAMDVAGLKTPTLYEDSWSGWILDPDRTITVGSTP